MRKLSFLGLLAALVIVGLLMKRQRMVTRLPAAAGTDPVSRQAPLTEQVEGALDEALRQGQEALERADADTP